MTTNTTEFRVYVGTYAKYTEGSIEGAWLDLADYAGKADFITACRELHKDEEDPELMFQDYEGVPSSMMSECSIEEAVWSLMDCDDMEKAIAYISLFGEWDAEDCDNKYYGKYSSDTELAEDYAESCGMLSDVPENLRRYFDFEAFGRDLAYDFSEENGYYFSN
jgi:antirestriction protein